MMYILGFSRIISALVRQPTNKMIIVWLIGYIILYSEQLQFIVSTFLYYVDYSQIR